MPAEELKTLIPRSILDNKLSNDRLQAIFNDDYELARLDEQRTKSAEQRYRLLLSLSDNEELEFKPVPDEGGIYRVERDGFVEFFVLDEENSIFEHDIQELIADTPEETWVLPRATREAIVKEAKEDVLEVLSLYLTEPQKLLMLNDVGVYILPEEHFNGIARELGEKRELEGYFQSNTYRKYNREIGGVRLFTFSGRRLIVAKEATSNLAQPLYTSDAEFSANWLTSVLRHEYLHALGVGKKLPRALREAAVEYYAQMSGEYRQVDTPVGYPLAVKYFTKLVEIAEDGGLGAHKLHSAVIGGEDEDALRLGEFFRARYGQAISDRVLGYDFTNPKEAFEFLEYQESMLKKRASSAI